jgi:hypothetical protein
MKTLDEHTSNNILEIKGHAFGYKHIAQMVLYLVKMHINDIKD